MSGFSEVRTALGNIVGDVEGFLALQGPHVREAESVCGGQVLAERSGIAEVIRVSHHVGETEQFYCYVLFDGRGKKGTFEWKCSPGAPIKGIYMRDFITQATSDEIAKLRKIMLAPKPIDPACLTYTVQEAARILGFPQSTFYDAIRRNEIPVVRLGRRMRVPRQFIDEQIAQAQQAAT